jgi:hypothetical protein
MKVNKQPTKSQGRLVAVCCPSWFTYLLSRVSSSTLPSALARSPAIPRLLLLLPFHQLPLVHKEGDGPWPPPRRRVWSKYKLLFIYFGSTSACRRHRHIALFPRHMHAVSLSEIRSRGQQEPDDACGAVSSICRSSSSTVSMGLTVR